LPGEGELSEGKRGEWIGPGRWQCTASEFGPKMTSCFILHDRRGYIVLHSLLIILGKEQRSQYSLNNIF